MQPEPVTALSRSRLGLTGGLHFATGPNDSTGLQYPATRI